MVILYSWIWILQDFGWYCKVRAGGTVTTVTTQTAFPIDFQYRGSLLCKLIAWDMTRAPLRARPGFRSWEKISRTQIWYCQFVRWGILGYHWIFKIWIRNPELFLSVWIFSFMLSILWQKSIKYTWINMEPRKWLMWLTFVSAGEWKNILNILWSVVFFLYYEVKLTDRIYSAEEFNYDPALWWHIT